MKKIIFILIISVSFIYSQPESISEAIKYYPLHIGDYWEYDVTKTDRTLIENWIEYKTVVGDTILSDRKYYIVKTDTNSNLGIHTSYLRIDSSNGNVYQYDYNYPEILFDSLFVEPNDSVTYECKLFSNIYSKNVFGENVMVRFYEHACISYDNLYYDYELAQGFGEIHKNYSYSPVADPISYTYNLVYAKIDGLEYGIKTDVENNPLIQNGYVLEQNYPNPFNPLTAINFYMPKRSLINLSVYDVLGRKVLTLFNGIKGAGKHTVDFDGNNLSTGIYYYTLSYGKTMLSRKMLLLK